MRAPCGLTGPARGETPHAPRSTQPRVFKAHDVQDDICFPSCRLDLPFASKMASDGPKMFPGLQDWPRWLHDTEPPGASRSFLGPPGASWAPGGSKGPQEAPKDPMMPQEAPEAPGGPQRAARAELYDFAFWQVGLILS